MLVTIMIDFSSFKVYIQMQESVCHYTEWVSCKMNVYVFLKEKSREKRLEKESIGDKEKMEYNRKGE